MRFSVFVGAVLLASAFVAYAQTADELVQKNIQAKGGLDKIKALNSIRMTGKLDAGGGVVGIVTQENRRPNQLRETFTLQGMTQVQAYDGETGWQIQPFGGHKEPALMGEDDLRDLLIDSDFDGPLVNYQEKGNKVEFLGHDIVDGDDALRLKVTLKNGDIVYYYLDPDAFLEIKTERREYIRGAVHETVAQLGSYKPVNGVMFPFAVSVAPKDDPTQVQSITYDKIEANVSLPESDFAVPGSLKEGSQKQQAKN